MRESYRKKRVRLSVLSIFDPWSSPLCTCPFKLSLNPYTGCSHMCIYCYATSYIGRIPSKPKSNLIKRLLRDIAVVDPNVVINLGTSSDPYPPEELEYKLTRRVLELLIPIGRRILITTKGSIVTRDSDLLSKGNAAVMMTVTTIDDGIAKLLEPGAPTPKARIDALMKLNKAEVPIGARIDPIIPYFNDDEKVIDELLGALYEAGVRFIVTSTYKAKTDSLARFKLLGELGLQVYKLYKEKGIRVGSYLYLPKDLRVKLLRTVINKAMYYGMEYATCREGFTGREWFNSRSCDGSHLIPQRLPPLRVNEKIDRWLVS